MKASNAAVELIKRFEGCRLEAYNCPAGVCTIGYGHTRGVYPGMTIDQGEADRLLREDIAEVESAVSFMVTRPLTQNQFDALVSFAFNIGLAAFQRSTLLQKINLGAFAVVPYEMNRWVHVNNTFSQGLQNRRNAEVALFQRQAPQDETY